MRYFTKNGKDKNCRFPAPEETMKKHILSAVFAVIVSMLALAFAASAQVNYASSDEQNSSLKWRCPYTDVKKNDRFYDDVEFVHMSGLMNGVDQTSFAPEGELTRAMFVTILHRAQGSPAVDYLMLFDDVEQSAWYAESVRWAASVGIVEGIDENTFAPNESITREQLATMILRYVRYNNAGPVGAWAIRMDYKDLSEISEYAAEAVMYCKLHGIMNGKNDNYFAPRDSAIRAECAAILRRTLTAIGK